MHACLVKRRVLNTLVFHPPRDLGHNYNKDHEDSKQHYRTPVLISKIQTVFHCGWLDKMRARKSPETT